jgi:opacity protein-like surface antigen
MTNRRCLFAAASTVVVLLTFPSRASADITGFIGVNATPSSRPVKGFAVGAGLLVAGFEFEYADTNEDLTNATELAPALRTFMFNGLVQTPFAIAGFQPYATAGAGVYRETLSVPDVSETNVGINVGGGVKMNLAGPLRLRFDYRVLTLKGNALHPTVQRFYAGVNLKF